MMELEDLTPAYGGEPWETWLVLLRSSGSSRKTYYAWAAWIALWRPAMDKYWESLHAKRNG
jgi:hypothetical protein